MTPSSFDSLSRAIGRISRRRSIAGAIGASVLATGVGRTRASAKDSLDRDALLASFANEHGGGALAARLSASGIRSAGDAGSAGNSKKKCKPCENCDCLTSAGYVYGMTDTLCILFHDEGSTRDACQEAGLACAQKEAACKSSEACFDAFLDRWIS